MNHPEMKIKGGTIVGMSELPEVKPVETKGADEQPAPAVKAKKSKSK
jgi:hypothetical protein